ncbi:MULTISPECIES: MarR family winged helix-turn-helix transcriptional regulator [unclassified Microbacterium]|uniref:MarR family winged helix-turn-helix transcriptional regulator n=1 Tax=unclassified Microbacterium TaxID=2609290 RepID=UPI0004937973|nr:MULTISPECIES: MarR family transcriptional regulator [unclassified Microbacterium]MCV0334025.1 MarR family transcriptional regulator [Microbacterium sp.]MCV0374447.1 MarR family transcriptional regulator [Microbacterium sp.]MCV0389519.1 MarR family transcriptional regulator [Microbacterium sp.]MCV0419053.1 MarR family transcriptional regulator [Microbacterium sp.]MCV0421359.1 MarR family transcriptional regulator [Microbacterium sp.]
MSASSDAPADEAADDAAGAPGETRASAAATDLLGDADLDQAVTRVEQELGRLFARIRIGWREAAATVHPDLQPLGYQVLTSIATGKATSAGAIIERLQTDKSAVSRQVRQLEQLGLVESVPDPEDRRARVLVATDLAQERVALARSRYEGRIGERLRNWTAADLDHFADLLAGLGG